MLPVACLPVASILIGLGYWILSLAPEAAVANFLIQAGLAIINNIPLLFAVGIGIGMSKDGQGVAALSALVSWLVVTTLLSPDCIRLLRPGCPLEAFDKSQNVFVAMLSGLTGAWAYNRFKDTDLPAALAFFSGKRSVAIVAAGISCLLGLVLMFVWPWLYHLLIAVGEGITGAGAAGAGLYVFLNRLLLPFGLHHALNQVFWFDLAGINDLGKFWSAEGTLGQTGMYMSGFFPMMMFGLPAAALAMYHCALPSQKKKTGSLMLAGIISSFFTGITEPLEFSFMFAAPPLYFIHALLSGLCAFVVAALPIRVGFNFSAGLIDWLLCLKAPLCLHPWGIVAVGLVLAVIYYFVFRWCIKHFRFKTPGREEDSPVPTTASAKSQTTGYQEQAAIILQALGGSGNIEELSYCTTRLRIVLKDKSLLDEAAIRATKISGIIHPDEHALQIVIGPKVQFLADALQTLMT